MEPSLGIGVVLALLFFPQVTSPTPSAVYSQSNAPTVTAILIVIFIGGVIAGVAYYFTRHKNDAFRFQYFKVRFYVFRFYMFIK